MSGKADGINRPSSLLKQSENEEIFKMVGRGCKVSWADFAVLCKSGIIEAIELTSF